jgi:hypothetical protein
MEEEDQSQMVPVTSTATATHSRHSNALLLRPLRSWFTQPIKSAAQSRPQWKKNKGKELGAGSSPAHWDQAVRIWSCRVRGVRSWTGVRAGIDPDVENLGILGPVWQSSTPGFSVSSS